MPTNHARIADLIWWPGRVSQAELELKQLALANGLPKTIPHDPYGSMDERLQEDLRKLKDGMSSLDFDNWLYCVVEAIEPEYWSDWFAYFAPRQLLQGWFEAGSRGTDWNDATRGLLQFRPDSKILQETANEELLAHALARMVMHPLLWEFEPAENMRKFHPLWSKHQNEYDYDPEHITSRALFLAWRYLKPEAISPWLRSALNIPDLKWRQEVLEWLVHVQPLTQEAAADNETVARTGVRVLDGLAGEFRSGSWWESEHFQSLPPENLPALRQAVRDYFDERQFGEWVDRSANLENKWRWENNLDALVAGYLE